MMSKVEDPDVQPLNIIGNINNQAAHFTYMQCYAHIQCACYSPADGIGSLGLSPDVVGDDECLTPGLCSSHARPIGFPRLCLLLLSEVIQAMYDHMHWLYVVHVERVQQSLLNSRRITPPSFAGGMIMSTRAGWNKAGLRITNAYGCPEAYEPHNTSCCQIYLGAGESSNMHNVENANACASQDSELLHR